jgi:hypothetical protein
MQTHSFFSLISFFVSKGFMLELRNCYMVFNIKLSSSIAHFRLAWRAAWTHCGQAFGAKQYYLLGIYMQRAIFVLSLVSVVVAIIWYYTGQILLIFGQDPEISAGAGSYIRWMIPTLFVYGPLQCHVRFLQTQNIVIPVMLSSGITALNHVLVCWMLVYKLGLGNKGAAVANSISYLTNVSILAIYIRLSLACTKTWRGLSKEAFRETTNFLRLGVPSALMVWCSIFLPFLIELDPTTYIYTAWSGGHLSSLCCFLDFSQTLSSRHQYYPSGEFQCP